MTGDENDVQANQDHLRGVGWSTVNHADVHDRAMTETLDSMRQGLAEGADWVQRERIAALVSRFMPPVRVNFCDEVPENDHTQLLMGVWSLTGSARHQQGALKELFRRTATACAVHIFPVRVSPDGTVFDKSDPACPIDTWEGIVMDAVCRLQPSHETVGVEVLSDVLGPPVLGPPQVLDLDASLLMDVLPWDRPPRSTPRRRRPQPRER